MSNRQVYPAANSPLQGDVISTPGSNLVKVVGIQSTPVDQITFSGGEIIEYNLNVGRYQPILRACVQVNNLTVSTDYDLSVNTPTGLQVNGSGTF